MSDSHQGKKYESFEVSGEQLLATVKRLIKEGDIRRIIIKKDGNALIEIPLNAGLAVTAITAVVSPVLIAVGAIAAVVTQVTIVVVRDENKPDLDPETLS